MGNKRGFTLIETLVSLSILAIIVTFMLPAFYSALIGVDKSVDEVIMTAYAQELMETYKSSYFNEIIADYPSSDKYSYEFEESDMGSYRLVLLKVSGGVHSIETELLLPKENFSIYSD